MKTQRRRMTRDELKQDDVNFSSREYKEHKCSEHFNENTKLLE